MRWAARANPTSDTELAEGTSSCRGHRRGDSFVEIRYSVPGGAQREGRRELRGVVRAYTMLVNRVGGGGVDRVGRGGVLRNRTWITMLRKGEGGRMLRGVVGKRYRGGVRQWYGCGVLRGGAAKRNRG